MALMEPLKILPCFFLSRNPELSSTQFLLENRHPRSWHKK